MLAVLLKEEKESDGEETVSYLHQFISILNHLGLPILKSCANFTK